MTAPAAPRVKGNDWRVLAPPDTGSWKPRLSVSVVIPAYHAQATLPYTLGALAAQSYPPHLLEVVVVDDGDGITLPDLRPENTRVVRVNDSWGRANACRRGAEAAEGDVLHWLDADMVPYRDQVAAQMRWHHVLDHAVVLGYKAFLDADGLPSPQEVREAVAEERLDSLVDGLRRGEHKWVERIWRRTADLAEGGFRAFHVHVGATASVSRELYESAGGMDAALKLGEDIELGYRLSLRGAVFIGDRTARSLHLGLSTLMRQEQAVQRYNAPFIAERVPDFRKFRQSRGRTYQVPLVEVVVDAHQQPFEAVKFSLDGVLRGAPGDVRCLIVGPWSQLTDERRRPLEDPLLESRLTHEEYVGETRVELVEEVPDSPFPAAYRLRLPAGWSPGSRTVENLILDMQDRVEGLRSVLLPDGQVVRLERTAALARARMVMVPGENLDDVIDQVSGSRWAEGHEEGFVHVSGPTEHIEQPDNPALIARPPRPSVPVKLAGQPTARRLRRTASRLGLRARWRE